MDPSCKAPNHPWAAHLLGWKGMPDMRSHWGTRGASCGLWKCSTGSSNPSYISTDGTLNFGKRGIAMSSWSTEKDAPIFLTISSYFSLRLRKLWYIFFVSSLPWGNLLLLYDIASTLSTWLGMASSLDITLLQGSHCHTVAPLSLMSPSLIGLPTLLAYFPCSLMMHLDLWLLERV